MTISSSNQQSVLLINTNVASEGMMAGQLQAQVNNSEGIDQSSTEEKFWAMLSQQLTDITSQDDPQVIENKDLLALFNEFETGLENAEDGESANVQWMQFLKSHFAEIDTSSDTQAEVLPVEQAVLDNEITEQHPLLSVLTQAESEQIIVSKKGEHLPPVRQVLSAEFKTNDNVKNKTQSETLMASAVSDNESDDEGLLFPRQIFDATGKESNKTDELISEKMMLKKSFQETAGIQMKEPSVTTPALASQPVSMTQLPQSSSQLPTALQSLQMSSQSPVSEWGDALGERVSFLINNKLNSAEIRIDPPHLGKLDIQIQVKDDNAVVVINTQNAQAKELIDTASVRLKEFLQEAGYNSVDVNVSHQEQSMGQDGFAEQGQSGSGDDWSNQDNSDKDHSAHAVEMFISTDDGRIDYFA